MDTTTTQWACAYPDSPEPFEGDRDMVEAWVDYYNNSDLAAQTGTLAQLMTRTVTVSPWTEVS